MAKMPPNPLDATPSADIGQRKTKELPLRDHENWSGPSVDAVENDRLEWKAKMAEMFPAPKAPTPNISGSTYKPTTRERKADVPWA